MSRRDEYAAEQQSQPNIPVPPAIQPISATSLPLPTGAATEATLAARATEATLATIATEATLLDVLDAVASAATDLETMTADLVLVKTDIADLLANFESLMHSGAWKVIDETHEKIHDGEVFTYCDEVTGLADATTTDYLVTTGTAECHFVWDIHGDTGMRIQVYEDTTTSADGTAQTIRNRNRTSANTPLATIHKGPTVTAVGTLLCQERRGSGSVTARAGGESRGSHEWVLDQSSKYLIRITSLSGGGSQLNVSTALRFYEVA